MANTNIFSSKEVKSGKLTFKKKWSSVLFDQYHDGDTNSEPCEGSLTINTTRKMG